MRNRLCLTFFLYISIYTISLCSCDSTKLLPLDFNETSAAYNDIETIQQLLKLSTILHQTVVYPFNNQMMLVFNYTSWKSENSTCDLKNNSVGYTNQSREQTINYGSEIKNRPLKIDFFESYTVEDVDYHLKHYWSHPERQFSCPNVNFDGNWKFEEFDWRSQQQINNLKLDLSLDLSKTEKSDLKNTNNNEFQNFIYQYKDQLSIQCQWVAIDIKAVDDVQYRVTCNLQATWSIAVDETPINISHMNSTNEAPLTFVYKVAKDNTINQVVIEKGQFSIIRDNSIIKVDIENWLLQKGECSAQSGILRSKIYDVSTPEHPVREALVDFSHRYSSKYFTDINGESGVSVGGIRFGTEPEYDFYVFGLSQVCPLDLWN